MVTATTIRVVRAYLGLTQRELAEWMEISPSLVSSIENGMKRISSDFSKRFKQAVGITDTTLINIQYIQTKLEE